ncbi:helix-turn-helix transcriptional regulator [Rahnella sp. SAP-1]|uniref:Helix-turn-helix transcriptional regulator n=1 Tax=Rouxiella aceris TaxID=2703884 RepID=A0A848MNJ8_9GAMM|nr:helix-turn-helix transcriptional regulator [Rouxiella aceris]NMP29355.1 helix-turn-helix transcriptional regulator [Rouxiella aceris]
MKQPEQGSNSVRDTINKIKSRQSLQETSGHDDVASTPVLNNEPKDNLRRQRVSNNSRAIGTQERKSALNAIIKRVLLGELTQGQALKTLRIDVLGMKQDAFAKLVSVSRKTLSEVENDKGNYTSDIINKLFKPFGLQVGLVPSSRHLLATLFNPS